MGGGRGLGAQLAAVGKGAGGTREAEDMRDARRAGFYRNVLGMRDGGDAAPPRPAGAERKRVADGGAEPPGKHRRGEDATAGPRVPDAAPPGPGPGPGPEQARAREQEQAQEREQGRARERAVGTRDADGPGAGGGPPAPPAATDGEATAAKAQSARERFLARRKKQQPS